MKLKESILQKITGKKVLIGVVGLGYVGLPLAISFAKKGITVIGFEKSTEKVKKIKSAQSYIRDVKDEELRQVVEGYKFSATNNFAMLTSCDAILICVPTPLDVFKKPDMSFIRESCESVAQYMKPGTIVCVESTTYPTTTESFILPILEENSEMKHGEDFWLAYSPERVDPGNKDYSTSNTPKIIGAMTEDGLEIGKSLYQMAIDTVHTVSSPRIAEMVKILENTYRLVNISLVNEMALLCGKMDINIWEVIEAAATKPYGFHAFYPGPGIGGHCIPLDPFYLEHIAKKFGFDLSMIHTAGHINNMMAHRMTIKITSALNRHKKALNGSKILFLGVAYKPNIDDSRESAALKIMEEVKKKGGEIFYHDPYISKVRTEDGYTYHSSKFSKSLLNEMDCVVISTNHDVYNSDIIVENSQLIVDLQNVVKESSEKVYKL